MEKAIEIIKREIAQRSLAMKIKNNLREKEIQEELDSLNKALQKLKTQ